MPKDWTFTISHWMAMMKKPWLVSKWPFYFDGMRYEYQPTNWPYKHDPMVTYPTIYNNDNVL